MATGGSGGASGAVRAGAAFVELYARDAALVAGLARAQAKVAAFARTVQGLGRVALGAGAAAFAPLAGALTAVVGRDVAVARLAAKIGETVETLSALGYAAETTGVSFDDLEGHFENFAERVKQAAEGGGEAVNTFRQLNIDATKLIRLNPAEQFAAVADALNSFSQNDTVRNGLLSSLGGDQFQKLNTLLRQGSGGIRGLMREAAEVGAVVTTGEANNAQAVQRAWLKAYTAVRSAIHSVGAAFLPLAEFAGEAAGHVVRLAAAFREWVAENRQAVQIGAAVALGVGALGAALVGTGTALSLAATGLAALGAVAKVTVAGVGLLLSPLGLAAAAVGTLTYAFFKYTEAGRAAKTAIGEEIAGGWLKLRDTAVTTWDGITDAVEGGDLAAAFQIAWAGAKVVWSDATAWVVERWREAVDAVTTVFDDGCDFMADAWAQFKLDLTNGVLDATQFILDTFPETVGAVSAAFEELSAVAAAAGDAIAGAFEEMAAVARDVLLPVLERIQGAFDEMLADGPAMAGLIAHGPAGGGDAGGGGWVGDARKQAADQVAAEKQGREADRAQRQADRAAERAADQEARAEERRQRMADIEQMSSDARTKAAEKWAANDAKEIGEWLDRKKGPDLSGAIAAARGTFGSYAAAQVFGGGAGANDGVKKELKEGNNRVVKVLEDILDKLGEPGGIMFT